jgi:arsenite/tail-anchored protein-transporting ATPase
MSAVLSARTRRTLLVTTDPASTLSAVLKTRIASRPTAVRGARGLFAANIDAARAFKSWLEPRRELIASIAVRGTYLDDEDVARLLKLSLPGIDEVIGLLEIVTVAHGFDAVFVDTAPTGHTLRLFSSPALMGRVAGVLDVLQAHHRAVVNALRGRYDIDASDALIQEIAREGEELETLLRDRNLTELCWVTLPEPAALEETADALTALERGGLVVSRLIVNRVTTAPADHACEWCDARRTFERRAMAPLAIRFPHVLVQTLPDLVEEPTRPAALRRAAASLGAWRWAEAPAPLARRVRVSLDKRRSGSRADLDELVGDVRWLLFGGKGGVGKSTCAAAAAVEIAASQPRRRVLLLSTDPAHSLADIFGTRLSDRAQRIPGAPANLRAREIDAVAGLSAFRDEYIEAVDTAFSRITRPGAEDHAAFRQLIDLAPPGIDEVIAIAEVAAALSGEGAPDLIVTDTAPTGHVLRLLHTPAVLRDWTQALMAILLKYREIVGAGPLAELLVRLSQRLRHLQEALRDSRLTRFVVVTRAATIPIDQTKELMHALGGLGIAIAAVIVNATGAGTCARCRRVLEAQRRAVAELPERCVIIEAPAEMPPPHGARVLARWGAAWRRIA